jgi:hypothetical protein
MTKSFTASGREAVHDGAVRGESLRSRTAARNGAAGVVLGRDAKYKNISKIDPETGEILGIVDPMAGRVQRFILQAVARKAIPKFRTNNCLRVRQKGKDVEVWKSTEFKTTCYAGLQTCGSVWVCPVCSSKISPRRGAEIASAMASHKAVGGCVNMLTLTCPHQSGDNLADLLR